MKKLVLSVALIFSVPSIFGQSQYVMHSVFMYSFTRFVLWPPEESTGDFEIVVLGDSPILSELKAMSEKKKAPNNRTIHITKIASMADFKKGHILYLPADLTSKYPEAAAKVGDSPILIVTDQAPVANKGCINFLIKEGKLAFEMNQALMGKHKLRASAELSRLAIIN
jgi:hypothetical protein